MYISKKHISRRTVLKGVGATIALPLLDAMNPAATAWAADGGRHDAEAVRLRRVSRTARSWTAGRRSRPAPTTRCRRSSSRSTPFRQHLTIVSGLRNKPGETPEPHGYIERRG